MLSIEQYDEFVLAIDPALSTTGYAIINKNTLEIAYVNKIVTSPKNTDDVRINEILAKLFYIASQYNVRHVILEDGFSGVNMRTSLQLATLRGAIIGTFNFHKYEVYHMLPTEIRKSFGVGGNAKKEQIAEAVVAMYPNNKKLEIIGPYSDKQNKNKTSDMYDAISIGVSFIKSGRGDNTDE